MLTEKLYVAMLTVFHASQLLQKREHFAPPTQPSSAWRPSLFEKAAESKPTVFLTHVYLQAATTAMKLNFPSLSLLVSATSPLLSSAAVERQLASFISDSEIQEIFAAAQNYPTDAKDAPRWVGGVTPNSLLRRLVAETPVNFRRGLRLDEDGNPPFQIKTMTETTDLHVDTHSEDSCFKSVYPQETSTLVFLNTNKDAYFLHGEERVPVEAGRLVNFRADEPHQTVVNEGGHVQILVPFTHRELMPYAQGRFFLCIMSDVLQFV